MKSRQWMWAGILISVTGGCPDLSRSPDAARGQRSARPAADAVTAKRPEQIRPQPPAASTGTGTWSFASDAPGDAPAGFTVEVGAWRVVADDTAPGDKRALVQQAKSSNPTYNIALVEGTSLEDLDLSVRMKSIAGRIDQGGGLVWRAADAKNYYIARFNPLEDNFRVYTVKAGRRRMLQSARLKVAAGRWNTLRVTMAKDHIQCYLDGKKYLDVRDATFTAPGRIGLWTKADARTRFDELRSSPYKEQLKKKPGGRGM